jgi:hypothetical protein
MKRTAITLLFTVTYIGCGPSDRHNQIESARERIKDQSTLLSERDSQIKSLKIQHEAEIEKQAKDHAEALRSLKDFHAKQIADLETKNADLQMELGLSEKQRLALQGLLEQPDRLQAIHNNNNSIERTIWFTICLACLGVSGFIGSRYFALRNKSRDDLIRIIAKLGHQI